MSTNTPAFRSIRFCISDKLFGGCGRMKCPHLRFKCRISRCPSEAYRSEENTNAYHWEQYLKEPIAYHESNIKMVGIRIGNPCIDKDNIFAILYVLWVNPREKVNTKHRVIRVLPAAGMMIRESG